MPADPDLARLQPDETVRTQIPSTVEERDMWRDAASITERKLGLSPGALTVGPWARRALNAAARTILDEAQAHVRVAREAIGSVKP